MSPPTDSILGPLYEHDGAWIAVPPAPEVARSGAQFVIPGDDARADPRAVREARRVVACFGWLEAQVGPWIVAHEPEYASPLYEGAWHITRVDLRGWMREPGRWLLWAHRTDPDLVYVLWEIETVRGRPATYLRRAW